jgi:hypothetical protein
MIQFLLKPEFIMEADDRDVLKRKAEALASASYGVSEFMWIFEGKDQGYTELTIDGQCKYVVRPWRRFVGVIEATV